MRMSHSSTTNAITPVKLDLAIFSLVQMLLVMSGIETNPGPEIEKHEAGCVNIKICSLLDSFGLVQFLI